MQRRFFYLRLKLTAGASLGWQVWLRYCSASRHIIWHLWQRIGPFTTALGRTARGVFSLNWLILTHYSLQPLLQHKSHKHASAIGACAKKKRRLENRRRKTRNLKNFSRSIYSSGEGRLAPSRLHQGKTMRPYPKLLKRFGAKATLKSSPRPAARPTCVPSRLHQGKTMRPYP